MQEITMLFAANAVGGKRYGNQNKISGVSTDTRFINKGDLFVAIKGERFDGHDYIPLAYEKGATAVLSEYPPQEGATAIVVPSTRQALLDLAREYRKLFQIPVIGITGSAGKTTTKEMTASVVAMAYHTLKNTGNLNNEIGLPQTIFGLDQSYEAAVLEMGMNNFGEIARLSATAQPEIALINNIGVAHIENLGSKEGILKAKMEITTGLKPGATLILNGDDELLAGVNKDSAYHYLYFGEQNKSGVYAQKITPLPQGGSAFEICYGSRCVPVTLLQPGRHMILNALAAAAVGFTLNLSEAAIKKGLETFELPGMRMKFLKGRNGIQVINDCYNANPDSMKVAINVLAEITGKKAAILGDMYELGDYAVPMHRQVGQYAAAVGIDMVIAIGHAAVDIYHGAQEHMDYPAQKTLYYETKEDFLSDLEVLNGFSAVLIKASRAARFEDVADALIAL